MKKTKVAPTVTEHKPEDSEKEVLPNGSASISATPSTPSTSSVQEKPQQAPDSKNTPEVKPVSIEDVIRGISEEKVNMAEQLGVPIRPLLKWALQIERTQNQIVEVLVNKFGAKASPQAPSMPPTVGGGSPQPSTGGMGGIMQILELANKAGIMGGGSQEDPILEQLKKNVVQAGLDSMDSQRKIGKAIQDAIVQRLASEVVTKAAP